MKDPTTAKQQEVFLQIRGLLSEHFDSYVLVVETEINHPDGGEVANFWRGIYQNHSTAVGLLEKQKYEMLKDIVRETE